MKRLFFTFALLTVFSSSLYAYAEEEQNAAEPSETGVKSHGVVFNMASDRKIEKVGGIYQPEDLDKYVDRRIDEISEKIDKLQKQLDEATRALEKFAAQTQNTPPEKEKSSS